MMDITPDDNFFIEEPQKLRNNFFNKDKSMQMVELLTHKHHELENPLSPQHHTHSPIDNNKFVGLTTQASPLGMSQACKLTYYKSKQYSHHQHQLQLQTHLQKQLHQLQIYPSTPNQSPNELPRSVVARLEILCQAAFNTDDLGKAKCAVDTLVSACKGGCCFLERYIVMLVNFCTRNFAIADDSKKIKIDELLNRALSVEFDRQQLTENFRRPEYKLTSIKQIIQLLRKVQGMQLDYRNPRAIDWLYVVLDAYFVELATTDEAVDILAKISAQTSFQSALIEQLESSKCLLRTIVEQIEINNDDKTSESAAKKSKKGKKGGAPMEKDDGKNKRQAYPSYIIECINF